MAGGLTDRVSAASVKGGAGCAAAEGSPLAVDLTAELVGYKRWLGFATSSAAIFSATKSTLPGPCFISHESQARLPALH